ncbi:probable ATP-dependent RNA helicase DHX34 [Bactrocera tryoni]|uniref:probable ATP-dependent RNA helicase DHX34 n=1 Tax=Bactrocera tryoni TaxID=59916 RepID=UPI001A99A7FC|nr:probable ATP-dependent RNA helicase DHX34 [Bactrocera tryoni]
MSKSSKHFKKSSSFGEETNLINFSFCDHKSVFRHLLEGNDKHSAPIVEDETDFWKFVNKYESMLRSAGQPILGKPLSDAELSNPASYHKLKYIPLQLERGSDSEQLRRGCHNNDERIFTKLKARQFREIVLIYLDFKQKERFTKIKKLRLAQKSLPIANFKQKIQAELKETRVLIIAGDTGCGKSTQVPQYLYEFGYRSIACTQPRRLACVSLSKRVAHEMLDDYGSKVGFQIRFEKNKTKNTNIVFITEGLLLRQLAVEANLEQYDVLILDEIHERNLFGDFLLGVTKCLLHAKPDLKLILMSATINVELFHNYFKNEGAALIEVPGRLYPIKTIFMPPPSLELKGGASGSKTAKSTNRLDPAPYIQVLSLIDQKYPTTERGDVLIFVSGVNEITTVCDAAKEYAEQNSHWIILPLHSGLALADQDKVFDYAPDGMRKCIVSTNIAETSLTVDGVRFVIDSGKVKEMSYDSSCKGQRLKEFWVSKSSAEQRKGRAGRTGPGTCFRLFSEKQYDTFEAYPTPEIFRVPLETILLQMTSMGLPNVRSFPFIESPEEECIEQAIWSLKQHNALAVDEKITPLGKSLSNLPVDITIGKMLLMGCVFPDVEKILTLAAIMSVQNPFTNRAYTDRKCEQEREPLQSDQGDVFTLLCAYHEWLQLKWHNENTRKWCHKLGIEEQRFYEITKLRNQFQNILESCNMTCKNSDGAPLSSAERARRHGEVRQLKAIKRKQKYQEPRKRKVLKHSGYGAGDDEYDDAAAGDDIRDVDFRLQHDAGKLEVLLNSAKGDKLRDVLLLKLILVSGFYPQIAIADEFNYCKSGSQQFFHTFLKPFISIHPNAYFAKYFDVLKLNDSDILDKPSYYTPKQLLSTRHQVLCYQNLLETAKPYLMNCIRMPAAQTLLLFSYSVDTNASVTRIVCDSWLCLEFPVPETGCELLCRAIKLRRLWAKLLSQKLTDLVNNVESQSVKKTKHAKDEESELWESLIDFISANVSYTIKRLLPADLKSLYTQQKVSNFEAFDVNPFAADYTVSHNEEKGGINVLENVVYGCLQEVQWTLAMEAEMRQHTWICKTCDTEMALDTIEKLLHKTTCRATSSSTTIKSEAVSPTLPGTSGSSKGSAYFCEFCQKELQNMSKIDILKHKKYCNKTDAAK